MKYCCSLFCFGFFLDIVIAIISYIQYCYCDHTVYLCVYEKIVMISDLSLAHLFIFQTSG